jgi:hypothetical protein
MVTDPPELHSKRSPVPPSTLVLPPESPQFLVKSRFRARKYLCLQHEEATIGLAGNREVLTAAASSLRMTSGALNGVPNGARLSCRLPEGISMLS